MTETDAAPFLGTIRKAGSRREAARAFLERLAAHADAIDDSVHRAEQVYRFETPRRPWFQFDLTGFAYQRSAWATGDLDRLLDANLQRLTYQLESLPGQDFVPLLSTGVGTSDLIPRMFGVTFDVTAEGAVLQRENLIEELPRDLAKLRDVDVTESDAWRDVIGRIRFLAEETEGRVRIAYPQMQGPDTNAARLMDQSEMLMACVTHPDEMRAISNVWADVSARLILAIQEAVGDPALVRPRQRFCQPAWVRGLVVGDYLAVINPKRFMDVFAEAFEIMRRRVGPLFYHTCGPIAHTMDAIKSLPGLVGFECAYVDGQTKLTSDLARIKAELDRRFVLCSFEYPLGGPVQDAENLTARWLWEMSEGGGFMVQSSGTPEEGRAWLERLELV